MQEQDHRTDAELVALATGGDQGAFGAIYDRYADRLHTYCFVMLRDTHDAADATHDAFVKAATRLSQLRDPAKLRPWLFSIARNEAHAQGRQRQRVEPVDDLSEELVSDPDPAYGLKQEELKELVWSAVAGLQDRDREMMTLHLVEGLEGQELADALGVKVSHLHVMLSRMKDRVEKALGSLLIARRGQDDCEELAQLLVGWDGHFTLDVRSKVTRHVESCDICTENRAVLASPLALLPSVVFIPAPADLRGLVLNDANNAMAAAKNAGSKSLGGYKTAMAAVAAAVVAIGIGVGVAQNVGPDSQAPAVTVSSTVAQGITDTTAPSGDAPADPPEEVSPPVAPTTTAPPPTTTAPPPPPAQLVLSSDTLQFFDNRGQSTLVLTNTGGTATPWSTTVAIHPFSVLPASGDLGPGEQVLVTVSLDRSGQPEGDIAETISFFGSDVEASFVVTASVEVDPVILRPMVSPVVLSISIGPGCAGPVGVVTAIVTDDSPLASVVVRWDPTGGDQVVAPMTNDGSGYTTTIGPFVVPGGLSAEIVATDTRGNSQTAQVLFNVVSCV